MITSLTIIKPEETGLRKLFGRLRGDSVSVQVKHGCGVSVREVTYVSRKETLCAEKLARALGGRRLLCIENLQFPENGAFRRFESGLFSARLCSNMALAALEKCKKAASLSVCLYDPEARSSGLAENLLKYTGSLCVVTDNPNVFYDQINEVGQRTGACAVVTCRREQLAACKLVVAPFRIDEPLMQIGSECSVLTGKKPNAELGGRVYFDYEFRMPDCFESVKPKSLSRLYFCSALYALEGRYELGSIVPRLCSDGKNAQTVKSLAKEFDDLVP